MSRRDDIFAAALADMENRMKVRLSDMLPEEVAALVRACDKVASPFDAVDADCVGLPVRVCEGVHFWKLTIGASVWLDEVDRMLPEGHGGERYRLALVYACRHSREQSAFVGLDDLTKIEREIRRDFKTLAATPEEVNAALEAVLGLRPRPATDVGESAKSWAALCARLETQTGIPSREWIWGRSSSYALKCYHDLHDFARAYSAAKRTAPRDMLDELDDAMNALQALKVQIRKRVQDGD